MFRGSNKTTPASYITPLTDIAANIFAMMIMILLLAMISQQSGDDMPIGTDNEFSMVERDAMTVPQLVQHLYERRTGSPAVRIDVKKNGPFIAGREGKEYRLNGGEFETALAAQLQYKSSTVIRLYVFSHEWYAETVRTLRTASRSWQEISVPQALATADRTGWSKEFEKLLNRSVDRQTFRTALARLLAASDTQSGSDKTIFRKSPLRKPLSSRLTKWWRGAISLISLLIAFAFVLWVERHQ